MKQSLTVPAAVILALALMGSAAVAPKADGQQPNKKVIKVVAPVAGVIANVLVKEGDIVRVGDLLVQLDDKLARKDMEVAKLKVEIAEAEYKSAETLEGEAKNKYKRVVSLPAGAVSKEEIDIAKLVWERHMSHARTRLLEIKIAVVVLEKANAVLGQHEVRAPSDGVVTTLHRAPGEGAKALETVVEILPAQPK